MTFFLGIFVGSLLGFFLACFCVLAGRSEPGPSTETASPEVNQEGIEGDAHSGTDVGAIFTPGRIDLN